MNRPERVGVAQSAVACVFLSLGSAIAAESPTGPAGEAVKIWPGPPPGTAEWSQPETAADVQLPGAGRVVHVIRNVTEPTLTIVRPREGHATGAAMIVLPGGAFGALAWDLEGTEVARWLADLGIAAFVLKYRVHDQDASMMPRLQEVLTNPSATARFDGLVTLVEPRRRIAMDDGMQAVRVIRSHASEYGVVANRIGMMGFSAGAMTTISAVLESDAGARPDFAASIYGAMVSDRAPPKDGPPLFIAAAADDDTVPAARSAAIFEAWQDAGLRAELHIYETGGHGFGLGKPGTASATWTDAFAAWLSARGLARPDR
jgi:dienelactone hydrolase